MGGFRILVCSGDEELCASLKNQVGGWCDIQREEHILPALKRADESWPQLVILDLDHFHHGLRFTDLALQRCPVIALLGGENLPMLSGLVDIGVRHVLRRSSSSDLGELVHLMRRLLLNTAGSLRDYLGEGVQLEERTLLNANERSGLLDKLTEVLSSRRAPRTAISAIVNVADELVTNAIYNAPIDNEGNPKYASTSRRVKIELLASEAVTFRYGLNDGLFGFSVVDNFGNLRMRHFRRSIHRCLYSDDPIEQKAGGAGLGLFLSARSSHQLIVNVQKGTQTEIVALWSLDRKRLRAHRAQGSLLMFEEEQLRRVARQRVKSDWTCLFSEASV